MSKLRRKPTRSKIEFKLRFSNMLALAIFLIGVVGVVLALSLIDVPQLIDKQASSSPNKSVRLNNRSYLKGMDGRLADTFDINQDFTIEAFVKVNSFESDAMGFNGLVSRHPGSGEEPRNFGFGITETYMGNFLVMDIERPGDPRASFGFHGQTDLKPGVWYHLAVVRTSDEISLYVNGRKDGSKPITPRDTFYNHGTNMYFGADWGGFGSTPHYYFDGEIDELRISAWAHYTQEKHVIPSIPLKSDVTTVALYHFDNDLTDGSYHGHNLEQVGKMDYLDSTVPIPTVTTAPADYCSSQPNYAKCEICSKCTGNGCTPKCYQGICLNGQCEVLQAEEESAGY